MLFCNTKNLYSAAKRIVVMLNIVFSVLILEFYVYDKSAHAVGIEVQVTTARVEDFEFNATNSMFTFIDSNNRLWIGKVNPATGAFEPSNGRGVLVDTGAVLASTFGNGPEWIYSASGDEIVYTRYLPNQPPSAATARIAHAVPNAQGVYVPSFIDTRMPFVMPLGSLDVGDAISRISYQRPTYTGIYWREINRPETEEFVPQSNLAWTTWYTRR